MGLSPGRRRRKKRITQDKEKTMKFLIFRPDRRQYLTPKYLQWDADRNRAQICEDREEAETIRDWLAGICVRVQLIPI
jgi:hypothetical protein